MQFSLASLRRLLPVALAVIALAFGFGQLATSVAMQFGAPAQHAQAEPAAPAAGEAAPAAAEAAPLDQARLMAGLQVWKDGGCRGCHGWQANGEREGPSPQGPSLRTTILAEADIHMTVKCGRPGTDMPYFWREAYRRGNTDCYGVTAADLGDQVPIKASKRFTDDDIADVAYYLANYIKGRGEMTLEECEMYWGANNARCASFR